MFVNDGSRDGTSQVLERLRRQDPATVSVLELPRQSGKAEAVRRGMLAAFEASMSYVGFLDADLATPLSAITDFRQTLQRRPDIDLVMGSRLQLLGHDVQRTPARQLLGRTFALVASRMLGLPVHDTQCGAKLFRSTPTTRSLFLAPFLSRWIFDVEILARWIQLSAASTAVAKSIFEHPLEAWRDVPGSHLRPQHFALAFADLWMIYCRYLAPRVFTLGKPKLVILPVPRTPIRKRLLQEFDRDDAPLGSC